jgi:hypothetical protein
MQTINIHSRYGDLRHFVPVSNNLYRLDGEFTFCRMGGKQDQIGIDNNDLGFFDADGGPFIQEGYPIGTKLVKRIYLDNDKIMLEVE